MKNKTQLEFNVRIRVPSGDTSTITADGGRITIGPITIEQTELDDFMEALKRAVTEAAKLHEQKVTIG